jgi:hypothetical protein
MLQNFLLLCQLSKQIGKARSLSKSYVQMLSCDNSWPRLKILDSAEKDRREKRSSLLVRNIAEERKMFYGIHFDGILI